MQNVKPEITRTSDKRTAIEQKSSFVDANVQKLADGRYMCAICQTLGKQSSHMRRHIKMVHLKERKHACMFCGKTFASNQMRSHHENVSCKKKQSEHLAEYYGE